MRWINKQTCFYSAFEKPQAIISEESEGNELNGRVLEVELPRFGNLSCLYLPRKLKTQRMHTIFECEPNG